MTQTPPPGWYPDANGVPRYWDGNAWTDHVQQATPPPPPSPGAPYPPAPYPPSVPPGYELKKKKPFHKRVWFWIVAPTGVLIVIIVVSVSVAVDKGQNNPHTVVYSVTGTLPRADVDYFSVDGHGNDVAESAAAQTLPWTKTVTVKGDFSGFSVSATTTIPDDLTALPSGDLKCTITVDGKVVSTDTASGESDVVLCSGSGN